MTVPVPSAARAGLVRCHTCGLLQTPDGAHAHCTRCGTTLHLRRPNSLARTWALLIAAAILYIPANLLPIMRTDSLLGSQQDTIMSGVVYFWTSGEWPLATVVFVASILVPMLKLGALLILLVTSQRRSTWRPQQRTRLFRMVERIGRWSMLDIFVVTLTVALVHFNSLAVITAGPGAIAFASVVVLTMFAAMQFDPRLIWDPLAHDADAEAGANAVPAAPVVPPAKPATSALPAAAAPGSAGPAQAGLSTGTPHD